MNPLDLPPYIYGTSSDPWAAGVAFGLLVVTLLVWLSVPGSDQRACISRAWHWYVTAVRTPTTDEDRERAQW